MLGTADNLQIFKYVVRNTAYQYGKTATFMPKPLYGDNGSGHALSSIALEGREAALCGRRLRGIVRIARLYIGGFLKHAAAIVAFAAPTTNSYKRLVPGFEAPVNLAYSARNRSAAIRIPMFSTNPKLKRLEFRPPDPSCNPYLAFSAMLHGGARRHSEPHRSRRAARQGHLRPLARRVEGRSVSPGSLDDSLKALEADHDFLLKGDVFTPQLIDRWITYKREKEINPCACARTRWSSRCISTFKRVGQRVKGGGVKGEQARPPVLPLPLPLLPLPPRNAVAPLHWYL